MIIQGKNLEIRYWLKDGYAGCKLNDIGYDILPGQKIARLNYAGTVMNRIIHFDFDILEVDKAGLYIQDYKGKHFLPWETKIENYKKEMEETYLIVQPCEYLYESPDLKKLFKQKITHDDGIWYMHGGRRTISRFEENLKNFVKLGQVSIFDLEQKI